VLLLLIPLVAFRYLSIWIAWLLIFSWLFTRFAFQIYEDYKFVLIDVHFIENESAIPNANNPKIP